jgi:type IV pilus assembly protein PilA
MKRLLFLATLCVVAAACGPKPSGRSPRDRYQAAVDARLGGDAAGYYRELVALAHDSPDTREGRRARATLTGSDLTVTVAGVGVLAAIAIPNFLTFQARSRQSEARQNLGAIVSFERDLKQRTGKYSATLSPDFEGAIEARSYYYFLAPGRPAVSPRTEATLSGDRAAAMLGAMQLKPRVTTKGFLAVAVGNIDDDGDLDVWTADEAGNIVHFVDDLK